MEEIFKDSRLFHVAHVFICLNVSKEGALPNAFTAIIGNKDRTSRPATKEDYQRMAIKQR